MAARESSSVDEDRLRAHRMNTDVSIHELRDIDINRHAREGIRVVLSQMFFAHEKIYHVPDGHFGSRFQVLVKSHGNVARGCFRPGPQ